MRFQLNHVCFQLMDISKLFWNSHSHNEKMSNIDSPGYLTGHHWFSYYRSKLNEPKEYFSCFAESLKIKNEYYKYAFNGSLGYTFKTKELAPMLLL